MTQDQIICSVLLVPAAAGTLFATACFLRSAMLGVFNTGFDRECELALAGIFLMLALSGGSISFLLALTIAGVIQ